jgi:hypothetical protein
MFDENSPIYGNHSRWRNCNAAEPKMAGAAGLEPTTYGFGDRRSTN